MSTADIRKSCCRELLLNPAQENLLPDSNQERTDYLLSYLLNHDAYTKMDELSDFLCVSRSTLQISVKNAEEVLAQYHIRIVRKPNYGIRIEGSEFDIRRCICECLMDGNIARHSKVIYKQDELDVLSRKMLKLIPQYGIRLAENVFEYLLNQIYVAMKRIRHGHYVQLELPE